MHYSGVLPVYIRDLIFTVFVIFPDNYLFANLNGQYSELTSPSASTFPHHPSLNGHMNGGHIPNGGGANSSMLNGHGHPHHLASLGNSMPNSMMNPTPATTSPSSSSSMEEFYLSELGFPPRMKKKSRKPKGMDSGPMKRKSREGIPICSSNSYSSLWKKRNSMVKLFLEQKGVYVTLLDK